MIDMGGTGEHRCNQCADQATRIGCTGANPTCDEVLETEAGINVALTISPALEISPSWSNVVC